MANSKSYNGYIQDFFDDSSQLIKTSSHLAPKIMDSVNLITKSLQNGKKIVLFGNGGSAADAQHIAAEFVGRFNLERKSLAAIALTTDSSILTSISNDYSFDLVFSRQCESIVSKNDVVIGKDHKTGIDITIVGSGLFKSNNLKRRYKHLLNA